MNAIIQTGKTLLKAMAFANAGNESECMALLRQLDEANAHADRQAKKNDLPPGISGRCSISAPHPAQPAL